jgi:hypothetical protein
MKIEVTVENGIDLLCFHHKYTKSPFMELQLERLALNYNIMCDHAVIEA